VTDAHLVWFPVVLAVIGIGLIFTRSQQGWPKLAKQIGYLIPYDAMLGI